MREYRHRFVALNQDFEEEKERTFGLVVNMTRQYKLMRNELLSRIHELDQTITVVKEKLEHAKLEVKDTSTQKDKTIAEKEEEIAEWKRKMDKMAQEFGSMLKQTLDKMSERITITSEDWETGGIAATSYSLHDEKQRTK
eukprot:TRINITY_DN1979_c0_g2_i1.p1 TRINITY_DN1979_c0_g2~~TRINITY_DN1979_c0_g2_i1.p1  ORF type:complete len:140 (+),score=36.06 TRINITY_DN1979_c0_g2_i1:203-622(+)